MTPQIQPPANDALDDDALLAIIANNGEGIRADAGAVFIRRHLPYILRLCQSKLQNTAEAEEAAQDVFLSVWKNAGGWQGKQQGGNALVTTWLYRIASNRCIDILRRRRPMVDIDTLPEFGAEIADDSADVEAAMKIADQNRLIRAAMAHLSDDQNRAIDLIYYKEMKQHDAAEIMGITRAALESILRRARARLHEQLAAEHATLSLIA